MITTRYVARYLNKAHQRISNFLLHPAKIQVGYFGNPLPQNLTSLKTVPAQGFGHEPRLSSGGSVLTNFAGNSYMGECEARKLARVTSSYLTLYGPVMPLVPIRKLKGSVGTSRLK